MQSTLRHTEVYRQTLVLFHKALIMDNTTQARVTEWRAKAQAGTLTVEEMREAIKVLRAGRVSAAFASETARRKKAKAVVPSADDLLSELGGL